MRALIKILENRSEISDLGMLCKRILVLIKTKAKHTKANKLKVTYPESIDFVEIIEDGFLIPQYDSFEYMWLNHVISGYFLLQGV